MNDDERYYVMINEIEILKKALNAIQNLVNKEGFNGVEEMISKYKNTLYETNEIEIDKDAQIESLTAQLAEKEKELDRLTAENAELKSALEKAEQENRWISLTERYPTKEDADIFGYVIAAHEGGSWALHYRRIGSKDCVADRWKPMPKYEAPKGE